MSQQFDLLGFNAVFNIFFVISWRPVHLLIVSWLSHTRDPHNIFYKKLATLPHSVLANWWKTNDACHNDICQTTELLGLGGTQQYIWYMCSYVHFLFPQFISYPSLYVAKYIHTHACFNMYTVHTQARHERTK